MNKFHSPSSVRSVSKNSPPPAIPDADELAQNLEHLELQLEHAQSIAQDSPNLFLKAAMNIASVDFFTVLNRFDTHDLIKRLHEKPELYFRLINAQANLMKASLEQQKFEFKQKQAEAKHRHRAEKLRARKPILLTDDTLNTFHSVLTRNGRLDEADPPAPALFPTQDLRLETQDSAQKTQDAPPNLVEFPPQHPWLDRAEEYSDDLVCSSA